MAESRQDELYDALQLKDIQKIFAGKLHTGR